MFFPPRLTQPKINPWQNKADSRSSRTDHAVGLEWAGLLDGWSHLCFAMARFWLWADKSINCLFILIYFWASDRELNSADCRSQLLFPSSTYIVVVQEFLLCSNCCSCMFIRSYPRQTCRMPKGAYDEQINVKKGKKIPKCPISGPIFFTQYPYFETFDHLQKPIPKFTAPAAFAYDKITGPLLRL